MLPRSTIYGRCAAAADTIAPGTKARPHQGQDWMKRQNLTPKTDITEPALELDFPRVQFGIAESEEGPTGCTVIAFDRPAELLVDVRGGAPYAAGDFGITDALCLTGGSVYGIEAVAGVNRAILEVRGNNVRWDALASVAGAVIYDFGSRGNATHPDAGLGYAAGNRNSPAAFPLERRGLVGPPPPARAFTSTGRSNSGRTRPSGKSATLTSRPAATNPGCAFHVRFEPQTRTAPRHSDVLDGRRTHVLYLTPSGAWACAGGPGQRVNAKSGWQLNI